MAFGYGAGGFIQKAGFNRPMRQALFRSGIGMTVLFVLLRIPNLLDPDPWALQARAGFTLLSFILGPGWVVAIWLLVIALL